MGRPRDTRFVYAGICPVCADTIKEPFTRGNVLPFAFLHARRVTHFHEFTPRACRLIITVPLFGAPVIEVVQRNETLERALARKLDDIMGQRKGV